MTHTFYANGKLLLTGEYFVLDGALALALPVKLGQAMSVSTDFTHTKELRWKSLDHEGNCWFEAVFHPGTMECLSSSDEKTAARLQQILSLAKSLSPSLQTAYCQVQTALAFPREWGLGTSSTLLHLIAQWAEVDAYELLFQTFGGSGYDIACAGAGGPVLYLLENGKPQVENCAFEPPFSQQLYFVYLGKKQDSREGIAKYRGLPSDLGLQAYVGDISTLTRRFLQSKTLAEFEKNILEHEQLIDAALGIKRAKDLYFSNFWGEIKSLGAWGGDFVLATSNRPREETQHFFNEKGFSVFLPYNELVL
jgi:mevalonate kinase